MRRPGHVGLWVLGASLLALFTWFLADRGSTVPSQRLFDVVYLGDVVHVENLFEGTLTDVKVLLGSQRVLLSAKGKLVPEPAGRGEPYGHRFETAVAGEPISLRKGEVAEFHLGHGQQHHPLVIVFRQEGVVREEGHPGIGAPGRGP